jgi:3-oxoacyl-[acyl-carrier protein] reductase
MDLGLKDKVAVVAASSKGLGKAVAWQLAREGAKLVICARNKEMLEATADEILLDTGVTVFPLAIDLSDGDQIRWMIDETLDLFGRVDILITNSGGPTPGDFDEIQEEDWKKASSLTLYSVVRLIRAVLPSMRKLKWGRIINLTSISVKQPLPGLLLSNALRPAVVGLTKSLAEELAPDNILVNAICPGYFMTDRVKALVEDKASRAKKHIDKIIDEMVKEIPLGRMGDPKELADLVAFLASPRSGYITGAVIQVDGGMVKSLL